MDDRSDSIEERKLLLAGQGANRGGEVGRCKGTRRYDHAVPLVARYDLATLKRHQWMRCKGCRHRRGKAVAIDGEGASRGHLIFVRCPHDERTQPTHFFMQQTNRIVLAVI